MSLNFGICWIEDQASEAEVDQVEKAVRDNGFEPKIEMVEQPDDIRAFSERQNHHQDFDLILLDLNLGDGLRGDELAEQVRSAFRSTTLLFYSGESESSLRDRMAAKKVEGVYCINRGRLSTRVGELVAHLSPALNRLSSMRGLAARVVAECDQDFRAVLAHLGTAGASDDIIASLRKKVCEANEKQCAELGKLETLDAMLSSHGVHSAALFAEVKERAQAAGGDELLAVVRKLNRNYVGKVIKRRNTLAHALEERTDDGWRIARNEGDPVTVTDFPQYRQDFGSQLALVRRLRALMLGE